MTLSILLGGGVESDFTLNPLFIFSPILLEKIVCFGLRRRFGVRRIEEILDAEGDLLDGDGGSPALIFVKNG